MITTGLIRMAVGHKPVSESAHYGVHVAPGALQVRGFRAASGETIVLHELTEPRPGAYRLYRT